MPELTFDNATHTYMLGNKKIISVTQLLKKHGLAPNYDGVNTAVMERKAEYGILIHKELEEYVKSGIKGFTDELNLFIDLCEEKNIVPLKSEFMVFNGLVAGTVDLLAEVDGEFTLIDYKTTSTLHIDSVEWQLSIYAYLYGFMNGGKQIEKIKAIHFNNGKAELVDLKMKPKEKIEELLSDEEQGIIYTEQKSEIVSHETLEKLANIYQQIEWTKKHQDELNAQAEAIKNAFIELMEREGIKSLDNEFFKATYIAPRIDMTLDSKKLQAEQPELCKQYLKEKPVKASVRITLKKD